MQPLIHKIIFKFLFSILIILGFLLVPSDRIYAASLSLSPGSTNVSVGNILSLKVLLNTGNKYVNNTEATVQFPTDILEVVSITKASSIFTLWVEEPSFSNYTGKVVFNGGVPSPGFNGTSGYIATITFKAKRAGSASVILTDATARENDGLGTDILTSKNGSVIEIVVPKEVKTPIKKEEVKVVPTIPLFIPTIRFDGIKGILRLQEENKVNDNIDYYTIQIDDADSFKIQTNQLVGGEYYLRLQNEGTHTITIVSFDKKGKYTENTLTFISPPISVPILSLNTYEITKNNFVIIEGKTIYPNSNVNVVLELEGKEIYKYTQTTRADGSFSITVDNLTKPGIVSIWAESILSDSVKSLPSEKIYLKVNELAVIGITFTVLYPLLYLIIIFAIVSLIFVLIYLGWHKFFGLKRRVKREVKNMALDIHGALFLLKEELNDQLDILEETKLDRELNKKEKIIFDKIKRNIDQIDDVLEKKLNKIL